MKYVWQAPMIGMKRKTAFARGDSDACCAYVESVYKISM